jgi:hypothetical protein
MLWRSRNSHPLSVSPGDLLLMSDVERFVVSDVERFVVSDVERFPLECSSGGDTAGEPTKNHGAPP